MAKRKTSAKRTRSGNNGGVNKSEEIRAYLREHPAAGPTEIVNALGKKGVKVTPSFVSNIKSKSQLGQRGPRRGHASRVSSPAAGSADFASFSTALVGAKKLARQLGGIEKAQQALDVLKRLQD